GRLLNLDEVRHLGHFLDGAKESADPSATGERLGHVHSSFETLVINSCPEGRPVATAFWTDVPPSLVLLTRPGRCRSLARPPVVGTRVAPPFPGICRLPPATVEPPPSVVASPYSPRLRALPGK